MSAPQGGVNTGYSYVAILLKSQTVGAWQLGSDRLLRLDHLDVFRWRAGLRALQLTLGASLPKKYQPARTCLLKAILLSQRMI